MTALHGAVEHLKKVPDDALEWPVEPISLALQQSARRRLMSGQHEELVVCSEVGRRLLLMQLTFSEWVLRRVEKVSYASDRRVARSTSVELRVPSNAPVVQAADGTPHWLVPLSVMRRQTLVNLDLRTEDDLGISLLGLRLTQKLDEAMLGAVARLVEGSGQERAEGPGREHTVIDTFIADVVSGTWAEVKARRRQYESWRESRTVDTQELATLSGYFSDPTFAACLERTWHNFTLYVSLPVEKGPHRVLHLAFEEAASWRPQTPVLERDEAHVGANEVWNYVPLMRRETRWGGWRSYLGLQATRIRFLTPSAENASSYHFEFTAPTGLWVTSAAFVAGRPNLQQVGKTAWDSVTGTGRSAGLHAVEIPNGSLCRAQVSLRVPSRGWLSTLAVSCWAVVLTLVAVAYHARLFNSPGHWTTAQITNIIVLLVTVCAGASTYVAQHPAGDVAARMVSGLRLGGVVVMSLPALAAVSLALLPDRSPTAADPSSTSGPTPGARVSAFRWLPDSVQAALGGVPTRVALETWLAGLTVIGMVVTLVVSLALVLTWRSERRVGRDSPWDIAKVEEPPGGRSWPWRRSRAHDPLEGQAKTFHELLATLGLDRTAMGVNSAEGWHERYGWNDVLQCGAVEMLRGKCPHVLNPSNPTGCRCTGVDHSPRVPTP